ncbi:head-tail connector protein [Nonomuraea recticatena]|uniref:Uncharacterized protein n=1 Tax=Nonomuraea recticatena TaxID=46178 RepID=A0ABN3S0S4_9ACTN
MLAQVSDVQVRLGRPLTVDEASRVQALIEDVSALVITYCRKDFTPAVPADVKATTCSEVIRLLNSNPGIIAEEIGEISTRYSAFRFGLSSDARAVLRPYRRRIASVPAKGVPVGL